MRRFCIYGLFFAIFVACSSVNDHPVPGVSLDLAQRRYLEITDLHYHLNISIPWKVDSAIMGKEDILFHLAPGSGPVILDFNVPAEYLMTVIINEKKIPAAINNEHILLDREHFQPGANKIELTFRVGESSLNRNDDFLYTLFVPDRASTAFPCFDQPDLKGSFQLDLDLPDSWVALANGAESETNTVGDKKYISFNETHPISTYLFAFVAGKFSKAERTLQGRTFTMLYRENNQAKVARNLDTIFELHFKALEWLEDYTGIPFPFQKFGFALIPAFQYGGMEHPGVIDYKASSLMLDASPTQNQLLGRASVIAHETAHMWFGDLVTMKWFNDVWMKEVFANFMAAKIVNPSFPDINHDLRFLLAHFPAAYQVDRSKGTHPIQQPLNNLKNAGTLYGSIIYQKAPIVMHKLEHRIGESVMQKGLQMYLNRYAYSNATLDDLIGILDSLSDERVTRWSDQWIKQAGMPEIGFSMKTNRDSTIKRLTAYQFSGPKSKIFWNQNMTVELQNRQATYRIPVSMTGRSIKIDSATNLQLPTFLLGGVEGYGYGYFRLGPLTREKLLHHMDAIKDPLLRGVGWLQIWESMVRGLVPPDTLLSSYITALSYEKEVLLVEYLLSRIPVVYWKFLSPDQRSMYSGRLEKTLWEKLLTSENNKLTAAYLRAYRSIAMTPPAVEKLQLLWEKKLTIPDFPLSESDLTHLAYELAIRSVDGYEDILALQLASITNPDRNARMKFIIPALSADQRVRDDFFESLKDEKNRQHESWVQQALGYLHHPLRASSSEKYITPTLEMLEELQRTGDIFFPKRVLDNTFSGHQSSLAVDDVRQFLYRHNHYPENLKNKILQSFDLTERAATILRRQRKDSDDQLNTSSE